MLGIFVFNLRKHKIKMLEVNAQLALDKKLLLDRLEIMAQRIEVEKSDGFVNFLAQSRDWAYKYIEDIQKALTEFDKELASMSSYKKLDKKKQTEYLDKIFMAYQELKTFLPEDNNIPNN